MPLPGHMPYARVMASKRTGKGDNKTPAQLSLVGAEPDTRTPAQRRADGLIKARKVAEERRAESRAARGDGPTNLERYRAGEYPVSEWTLAEVRRGRPEGRSGFAGPYPAFTGRQAAEIKKELLKRGQRRLDAAYDIAIRTLVDIAANGENESARTKAADLLIQRTAGKVPERIEIKSSDPWQDILDDIMDDEVLQRVNEARVQADS